MTGSDAPLDLDKVLLALGQELMLKRTALDLSRTRAVAHFESTCGVQVGERTLLAYEKGLRDLTVRRVLQLCAAYDASPVSVLAQAIHRANADCCKECGR